MQESKEVKDRTIRTEERRSGNKKGRRAGSGMMDG